MRRYFFDASAAVKLYVVEPGSNTVRDMVRSARATPPGSQVLVCDVVLPETVSALLQIRRSPSAARRGLSAAALRLILPQAWGDLGGEGPVLVRSVSEMMHSAARIVERHELRAADAMHVAAALDINASHPCSLSAETPSSARSRAPRVWRCWNSRRDRGSGPWFLKPCTQPGTHSQVIARQ